MNPLIDNTVQCWGCTLFDGLFRVISTTAAAVYDKFVLFCMILFCVLFSFFVLNAVWKNMRDAGKDPFYMQSMRTVVINAIVAFALLGMGVMVPRFVTTITFEPVAEITGAFTQSLLQTDAETVAESVTYTPVPMADNGFFRPQLRDAIIMIMKTTITQFQAFIKLGIAVMDSAFSWAALTSISALIEHVLIFAIGLYLVYGFFKLFLRFCFYFADVIIAMTFFAFFFPLSITLVPLRGGDAPGWMKTLGKNVGTNQFKKVISAIVGLAAAVLTYMVIMVIIAKFFSAAGASPNELMGMILAGDVTADNLSKDNIAALTITSAIVLVYVLNYIYGKIPDVTKAILGTFNVESTTELGDKLADDAFKLTGLAFDAAKTLGKTIVNGGDEKKS